MQQPNQHSYTNHHHHHHHHHHRKLRYFLLSSLLLSLVFGFVQLPDHESTRSTSSRRRIQTPTAKNQPTTNKISFYLHSVAKHHIWQPISAQRFQKGDAEAAAQLHRTTRPSPDDSQQDHHRTRDKEEYHAGRGDNRRVMRDWRTKDNTMATMQMPPKMWDYTQQGNQQPIVALGPKWSLRWSQYQDQLELGLAEKQKSWQLAWRKYTYRVRGNVFKRKANGMNTSDGTNGSIGRSNNGGDWSNGSFNKSHFDPHNGSSHGGRYYRNGGGGGGGGGSSTGYQRDPPNKPGPPRYGNCNDDVVTNNASDACNGYIPQSNGPMGAIGGTSAASGSPSVTPSTVSILDTQFPSSISASTTVVTSPTPSVVSASSVTPPASASPSTTLAPPTSPIAHPSIATELPTVQSTGSQKPTFKGFAPLRPASSITPSATVSPAASLAPSSIVTEFPTLESTGSRKPSFEGFAPFASIAPPSAIVSPSTSVAPSLIGTEFPNGSQKPISKGYSPSRPFPAPPSGQNSSSVPKAYPAPNPPSSPSSTRTPFPVLPPPPVPPPIPQHSPSPSFLQDFVPISFPTPFPVKPPILAPSAQLLTTGAPSTSGAPSISSSRKRPKMAPIKTSSSFPSRPDTSISPYPTSRKKIPPNSKPNTVIWVVSVLQSSIAPHYNVSRNLANVMSNILNTSTSFLTYPDNYTSSEATQVTFKNTTVVLLQYPNASNVTVFRNLSSTTSWRRYAVAYSCFEDSIDNPIQNTTTLQQIFSVGLSAVGPTIVSGSFLHQLQLAANQSQVEILAVTIPGNEFDYPPVLPTVTKGARTFPEPLSTKGMDMRRWVGLVTAAVTVGVTVLLMYLGARRETKLKQEELWGFPLGTEQDVGKLLNLGFMWQQGEGHEGPPKGVIVFNKERVGYRDDDSTLMGGFHNPHWPMSAAEVTLPSSGTS